METYKIVNGSLEVEVTQPNIKEVYQLEQIERKIAEFTADIEKLQIEKSIWEIRKVEAEKLGLKIIVKEEI